MSTPSRTNRRAATAASTTNSNSTPTPSDQGEEESSGWKNFVMNKELSLLALVIILLGLVFFFWPKDKEKEGPLPPSTVEQVNPDTTLFNVEKTGERKPSFTDAGRTPTTYPQEKYGAPENLNGQAPLKFPPIQKWITTGNDAVPVRTHDGQMRGYGDTYTQPPNVGVRPPAGYNRWYRNSRGDWALTR
jgi:hypothetical protein